MKSIITVDIKESDLLVAARAKFAEEEAAPVETTEEVTVQATGEVTTPVVEATPAVETVEETTAPTETTEEVVAETPTEETPTDEVKEETK